MFTLQVLNDSNEWELIDTVFASESQAIDYFNNELAHFCFDNYCVEEMTEA
jgi:hypothetical protein